MSRDKVRPEHWKPVGQPHTCVHPVQRLGGRATCKLWDGPRLANTRGASLNPGIKIQGHFVYGIKISGPLSRWMDMARAEEGQAGGDFSGARRPKRVRWPSAG